MTAPGAVFTTAQSCCQAVNDAGMLCGGDSASVAQRNQRMQADAKNGIASTGEMSERPWFLPADEGTRSAKEEALLMQAQSRLGDSWTRIANVLPGRSGHVGQIVDMAKSDFP